LRTGGDQSDEEKEKKKTLRGAGEQHIREALWVRSGKKKNVPPMRRIRKILEGEAV